MLMKVSKKTDVRKLAGAITGMIASEGKVELQAMGANAVNVAVKALTTAIGYCAQQGNYIRFTTAFAIINVEDEEERTAIKFIVSL